MSAIPADRDKGVKSAPVPPEKGAGCAAMAELVDA